MRWSKGIVYAALTLLMTLPVAVSAQFQMPQGTGLPTSTVSGIIGRMMSWLLAMFGMIAIIAFVISGIQYLTAAGDDSQAETAKRNMKYSVIGVMVGLAAYIIIDAINCMLGGGLGISFGLFSISLAC